MGGFILCVDGIVCNTERNNMECGGDDVWGHGRDVMRREWEWNGTRMGTAGDGRDHPLRTRTRTCTRNVSFCWVVFDVCLYVIQLKQIMDDAFMERTLPIKIC